MKQFNLSAFGSSTVILFYTSFCKHFLFYLLSTSGAYLLRATSIFTISHPFNLCLLLVPFYLLLSETTKGEIAR
jgi:hypothetical protein